MPKLRRTDFGCSEFEIITRLSYQATAPQGYHTGLLIQFASPHTEAFMFGPYEKTIAAERTGQHWLFGQENLPSNEVSLRIVADGSHYSAYYRLTDDLPWTLHGEIACPSLEQKRI